MATPKEERVVEIIVNGTKANASLKEMAAAAAVLSNQVAKIAADDPKRGELIAQLQQMRQRLTDTRAEVAGLVQSQQQLAAAQAATVAEQARAIAAGQASTASLSEMKTAAGLLEKQLHELSADDPGRAALIADFQALKARMDEARAAITTVVKSEAELRAEEVALAAAEADRVAEQQRVIAAGRQQSASYNELRQAAGLLEQQLHELSADDPGRAALIADYQALRARLEAVQQQLTRTAQSSVELVVNGQRVSASMREMRQAASELENQLDELAQDDPARGPLIAALQELRERIRAVGAEVNGVSETTSHLRQVMTYAFGSVVGAGIEGILDKVVETGKGVFETTAKFEKYGAVLTNALGSGSLAQKAMADINQLAATTPFSVDELTESFVKFVNRGLQPSITEMQNLADLAASQGKSFDQLTEAVLDAGTGEFERLKEFGIGASKAGDQVTLSFKNTQQVVGNTPEAINAAILAFGDMKGVMGSTEAIAQTLEGQFSNLGDTADQTAVEWGQTLRPVFVGVLSTISFLLGVLGALPGFLKENRSAVLGLVGGVLLFNAAQVEANVLLLYNAALSKGKVIWDAAVTISTRAWTMAQNGLNLALAANPIGAVIAVGMLLVGLLVTLYDKSEKFRAIVGGLGASLKEFALTYVQAVIEQLRGLGDVIMGIYEAVTTGNFDRLKKGFQELGHSIKTMYWDAGINAAKAFGEGYSQEEEKQVSDANKRYEERRAAFQKQIDDYLAKRAKQKADAEKKARLETLKNEEADLKERLAKVKADSEQEMRIKQQLVTNAASQELEDAKKTAAERRIILAEAEGERVKLAQEYYKKQADLRAKHAKEAAEHALKIRLAEIEAEKLHQQMLAQVKQAAVAARGDELVTEMTRIYTEGQLKRAELQAEAKKDIAQLTGTAQEKAARQRDIEQKLAADLLLLQNDVRRQQSEKLDKDNEEKYKKVKEGVDREVEVVEEGLARQLAAYEEPFHASLRLQRQRDQQRYEARQAAFDQELALVEKSLGRESAKYKEIAAAQLKDQKEHSKQVRAYDEKDYKAKQDLRKMEMQTASDALSFGLQLLEQDSEARKKHHELYVALAVAKVLVDGITEVQNIWEKSSEFGPAGYVLATVQTALAVARTTMAIANLTKSGGGSDASRSYAQGGRTGSGVMASSPMGQVLANVGVSVGGDGRLRDGTGFAVAGIVHEDEYVIPKWQRADPQVAAVEQWLEARRLRGFADGGPTSSGSSGATLPVAAASPTTDGEKTYAVQTQMLAALLSMGEQLADVKTWQRELQVQLNLRQAQAGLDEYKQVQYSSAIRSKSASGS